MWKKSAAILVLIIIVLSFAPPRRASDEDLRYGEKTNEFPICLTACTDRHARVLVAGASTGIGEQLALRYARSGARLVLSARGKEALEAVAFACREAGAESVLVIAKDLSTDENSRALVDEAVAHLGGLDVVLLNHIKPYLRRWAVEGDKNDLDAMRTMFEVNTFSYIAIANYALRHLEASERGGRLGVVSSGAGKMGLPWVAPYAASKHALHGFFNSLRHDLPRQSNTSITLAVLGSIDTPRARANTDGVLSSSTVTWHPSSDCASVIVDGVTARLRDVYYPHADMLAATTLYAFVPSLIDRIARYTMLNESPFSFLVVQNQND